LNRDSATVAELMIGNPQIAGKKARRELADVRGNLLDLDSTAAAPGERAIRVQCIHPGFAGLRVAG
jgi:hypothetical protein